VHKYVPVVSGLGNCPLAAVHSLNMRDHVSVDCGLQFGYVEWQVGIVRIILQAEIDVVCSRDEISGLDPDEVQPYLDANILWVVNLIRHANTLSSVQLVFSYT